MKFLSNNIGKLVLEELNKAIEAQIAVAFFDPNAQMLEALANLRKLTLVVSEDFASASSNLKCIIVGGGELGEDLVW
jgi:hypothetical protein